jgi:acyl carrier protein
MNHDAHLPKQDAGSPLQAKLLDFLQTLELDFNGEPGSETPLVGSGLLDSLALLRLARWIEGEVGRPLDPDTFDLQEEWKTVGKVVDYIQRHRDPS